MSGTQDSKLERILEELSSMKSKMPNGELKVIQSSIDELKHSQADIKSDVSEMKRRLLDPETGIVVRLNQNTQYIEDKKELEDYYEEIIDQHKERAREVSMRSLIQVIRIGQKFVGEKFQQMAKYSLTN